MNSRYTFIGKSVLISFLLCIFSSSLFAENLKASDIVKSASQMSSLKDGLNYLLQKAPQLDSSAESREVYLYAASIQEQLAEYNEAIINYGCALGLKSEKSSKSDERIKLDIVRCSLCMGETSTADSYLYELSSSKDSSISNYGKLYTQWSSLCKAQFQSDIVEPVELLKAYLNIDSMKPVHPVILLTLWYVTGSDTWASRIKKDFGTSAEAAIVKGDIQLLPVPFWFFVPKMGNVEQGTGTFTTQTEKATEKNTEETKNNSSGNSKFSNWQLGLFKSKENADILCKKVKDLGFDAYITSETRASGTTYYIVLVKDDKSGLTADKLRSAGYECYPVE